MGLSKTYDGAVQRTEVHRPLYVVDWKNDNVALQHQTTTIARYACVHEVAREHTTD